MTFLRCCVLVLAFVACGLVPRLAAAALPTQAEWKEVHDAITIGSSDADSQLDALIAKYPDWVDGLVEKAKMLRERQDWKNTWLVCRAALGKDAGQAAAAALGVEAKGRLGQPADAYKVADLFAAADPGGMVNWQASNVALNAGDLAKAAAYLAKGRSLAGATPNREFAFLAGRIAIAGQDFASAERELKAAADSKPGDYWDAWFELGRVRFARSASMADAKERLAVLESAEAAFGRITAVMTRDVDALGFLGRVHLEQARALGDAGDADKVRDRLNAAEMRLAAALRIRSDVLPLRIALGEVYARQGRFDQALDHLLAARSAGVSDRTLMFNLCVALTKAGRSAESDALLKEFTPQTGAECLTVGMSSFRSGNDLTARTMLESAVAMPDVASNAELAAQARRFAGHAARRMGEDKTLVAAARDVLLDQAAALYLAAGNAGDGEARAWYLAVQTNRDADRAYAAAQQAVSWSPLNPRTWLMVVGTYGSAATGGNGLIGMWERKPLHLVLWAAAAILPVLLFAIHRVRQRFAAPSESAPAARAAASARPGAPRHAAPVRPQADTAEASERKDARDGDGAEAEAQAEADPQRTRVPVRPATSRRLPPKPPGRNLPRANRPRPGERS